MSIEYKCVMLPSNEKAVYPDMSTFFERICFFEEQGGHKRKSIFLQRYFNGMDFINPQHLYIISDEEIKENEACWFYDIRDKIISNNSLQRNSYCKKIISSSDLSLELLPIPKSFIEEYISRYNAGDIITDVTMEFKEDGYIINKSFPASVRSNLKLNIIPKKPIKESWNREEVENIILKALVYMLGFTPSKDDVHTWINKNL